MSPLQTIDNNSAPGDDITTYGELMPSIGAARDNTLYVPQALLCPEDSDSSGYGNLVDNNTLNVTCGGNGTPTHGTYGDL